MQTQSSRHYARELARAFGGAVIFALPLLMTMEMWWLGFYLDRLRLALFLLLSVPLLIGLSYYVGFEDTFDWRDDVLDGITALAAGFAAAALVLAILGIIGPHQPWREVVGKVALQAVPAAMGAVVAREQFGRSGGHHQKRRQRTSYGGELFLMIAGALYFAFNVAPTEEMILIAYRMTSWNALALALASVAMLHALVYTVGFGRQDRRKEAGLDVFLRFTVVGYAMALLVSLYLLWTFGRIGTVGILEVAKMAVVLGFPAAIGAAIARVSF